MQKFVEKEHFKFHDLINNWPGKSGNLKPQESLQVLLLLLCFLFRSSPLKMILERIVPKFGKMLLENPQWNSVLVTGHRSSYLQKLNMQLVVLVILKQLFLEISSIDCYRVKPKIHYPFKWIQLNGNVKIGQCILKNWTIFTFSI